MEKITYAYCATKNNYFNYKSILDCIEFLIEKYQTRNNSRPTKIKLSPLHFNILREAHENLMCKPIDTIETTVFGLEFVETIDCEIMNHTIIVYGEQGEKNG